MRFTRPLVILSTIAALTAAVALSAYTYGARGEPTPVGDDWYAEKAQPASADRPARPEPPGMPGQAGAAGQAIGDEAARYLRRFADQLRELKDSPSAAAAMGQLDRLARQLDETADRVSDQVRRWGIEMHGRMHPGPQGEPRQRPMPGQPEALLEWRRIMTEPLDACLVAIHGIMEMAKDDSKAAANALQALLDNTEPLPVRTALHLALSDVLKKAGDSEGALDQLAAVVRENARRMANPPEGRGGVPPARPAPPPPARERTW
jgi:hypothetical protein